MIAFWVLAPIMVLAALGILFVRKAVHAALLLAVVMMSLAVLYAVLDAPFLFAVQIIVYTGAILMLFLFVVMLVGVDASDSVVETIKGQRFMAIVGGLALGAIFVLGLSQLTLGPVVGLGKANAEGIAWYQRLVELLLDNDITPCPTLFHWDLPQGLEDIGGFRNRDTVSWFADYAALMARELGDELRRSRGPHDVLPRRFDPDLVGRYAERHRERGEIERVVGREPQLVVAGAGHQLGR